MAPIHGIEPCYKCNDPVTCRRPFYGLGRRKVYCARCRLMQAIAKAQKDLDDMKASLAALNAKRDAQQQRHREARSAAERIAP